MNNQAVDARAVDIVVVRSALYNRYAVRFVEYAVVQAQFRRIPARVFSLRNFAVLQIFYANFKFFAVCKVRHVGVVANLVRIFESIAVSYVGYRIQLHRNIAGSNRKCTVNYFYFIVV